MKYTKCVFILLIGSLLFSSCKMSKEKELKKIEDIGKKIDLFKIKDDKKLGESYIAACVKFSEDFPSDSMASKFIFKSGILAESMGNYQEAISYFDRVCEKYPNSSIAPDALLQKGMVYDLRLNEVQNAEKCYYDFISKYPKDKNINVARQALQAVGKSPEEMVRSFERDSTKTK